MKILVGVWILIFAFALLWVSDKTDLDLKEKIITVFGAMFIITLFMVGGWLMFA